MQPEVEYCGHLVDKDGVRPMNANVEAVREAPKPKSVTELKAFLGMVNYYHGFLPKLSTVFILYCARVSHGIGHLAVVKPSGN